MILPQLHGSRIRLRPLAPADSSGMFRLWSEPAVCEFSGSCEDAEGRRVVVPTPTRAESDRLLDFWLRRAEDGLGLRWAVTLLENEEFVGAVGFNTLGRCPEYAYHLLPSHWGRGLAKEASVLALEWAFADEAEEAVAFIEPANTNSIHLAQRLGFVATERTDGSCQRYVLSEANFRGSCPGPTSKKE
ncbi:MAG: GNAT family N-acetyltransferase [Planctomycetota bacterium]